MKLINCFQFFFTTDIYTRLPITPNSKGSKQSCSTWCPGAPDLSTYRPGVLERPISQIIVKTRQYFDFCRDFSNNKKV